MVTFGIRPTSPQTGYGYIEQGRPADAENDAFLVERFVEKPDADTARGFVESGRHVWNSGIFMFGARSFLNELRKLAPEVYQGCSAAMRGASNCADTVTADEDGFASCPGISVDYAVMEKTDKAMVVPFEGSWSDIGSWSGLADALGSARADGNISVGNVVTRNVQNSYIHACGRLVAAVGVKDLIVVETDDAVLVSDKAADQDIKALVDSFREEERREVEHHSRVFRPWGSYQTLELQPGFQVKRLVIKPGASISLQLHHRRSEHWVVVKGEAVVTRGTDRFRLRPNESTYIPKETLHKLENPGDRDLEIIEVQTGDYLGEDDIERFEDQYGRV
jgi:mannose-1-phosphate guanylyltransferase/mannose-6-phosphate isomerase